MDNRSGTDWQSVLQPKWDGLAIRPTTEWDGLRNPSYDQWDASLV